MARRCLSMQPGDARRARVLFLPFRKIMLAPRKPYLHSRAYVYPFALHRPQARLPSSARRPATASCRKPQDTGPRRGCQRLWLSRRHLRNVLPVLPEVMAPAQMEGRRRTGAPRRAGGLAR